MLKNLVSDLSSYSTIAIFGFGKEGRSFYDFAKKYLPNSILYIVDKNSPKDIKQTDEVRVFDGDEYLKGLEKVDLIVKSPGISLYNLGIKYEKYNFTSTTELFIKHFKKQIIGVTGTKGKSTLVSIMSELFKNDKQKVILCGNIGTPAFELLEEIESDTKIVMELSSHQLSHIQYSPHIAIITNLFEDHLDYYKDLQEYYDSKFNILRYQDEEDIVILNLQKPNEYFSKDIYKTKEVYNVCFNELENKIEFNVKNGFIHKSSLQILEKIVDIFELDKEIYLKTINEFKTLAHRLEYVSTIDGIIYINDSISTIPEATIEAIKILKKVDSLIVGGFDRGIKYDILIEFLQNSNVQNIVLYSQTGKIIFDELKKCNNSLNLFYVNSLSESIEKVKEVTKRENSIVLFSPAASSFNTYKNFMERGDEYKSLVLKKD